MDQKQAFWRAIATIVIWVMVTGGFAIVSALLGQTLGDDIIGVLFLQLVAAVFCTGVVWNWGRFPGEQTKRREKQEDDLLDEIYQYSESPSATGWRMRCVR